VLFRVCPFRSLLVTAAVCLMAPEARAEALVVEVGAGLPFDEAELRRLVDLRVAKGGVKSCAVARVEAPEAGLVVVACPDRRSEVWVGDRSPEDAARVVAVVLADLVTSAPASPPPAPRAPAADVPTLRVEPPAPVGPGAPRLSWWLTPGVSFGLSGSDATLEARAGGAWAFTPRTSGVLEVGFARAGATDVKTAAGVTLDTIPLRGGVGVALGPVELRGGAVGRLYRARAGSTEAGVRAGGWLATTWTVGGQAAARSILPFVSVGLDAYLERLEVRVDSRAVLTAGMLSPWAALGVVWRGVRR
jgi:hypothetical protein